MEIIGVIIILVGLVGYIWACNYNPGLEAKLERLIDGTSSSEMEMADFFKNYGIIIIIVGAVILICGIMKKRGGGKKE